MNYSYIIAQISHLSKKCTAEPQSPQSEGFYQNSPLRNSDKGHTLFLVQRLLLPERLVDSYFPPSQRKIRKKNQLRALCASRERSERVVNKTAPLSIYNLTSIKDG